MTPVALVAGREFSERLRSRTFLISNATIMVLLLLGVLLPQLLASDDDVVRIGSVGPDAGRVLELATSLQPAFDVAIEPVPVTDRVAADEALEQEDLAAVLLDGSTVLVADDLRPQVESLLTNASNLDAIDQALEAAGVDPGRRASLFAVEPLVVERVGPDDGLDLSSPSIGIVVVAVFMLYGLLALYGQWVAQGIVEEKQSRVVEVLLATLRPRELLAGKVLGLGALGLAQILLMSAVGVGALLLTDSVDVPGSAWGAVALVLPWYVLGFLLYASLFAVAGATVARVEDVQAVTMPVIMVLVLALFAAQFALGDPTGTVATVAGILPLTAPIVQPILFAAGATSWLEVVGAIALAVATIAALLPLAARVYGGGVLRTRGRVSLREAWGGVRAG